MMRTRLRHAAILAGSLLLLLAAAIAAARAVGTTQAQAPAPSARRDAPGRAGLVINVKDAPFGAVGDGIAIFASKGGAPDNPDWFHNIVANPEVTVEIGTDTVPMRARVAGADEREPIWSRQKEVMPGFAEYAEKAGRVIPVIRLTRA